MLRVLLTVILPLLLPTALYLLWVSTLAGPSPERRAVSWTNVPWLWLAGIGAALLAIVLIVVSIHFGSPQQGVYVPPRWDGHRIIPGHIEPAPSR
jgi:hypothetical protein